MDFSLLPVTVSEIVVGSPVQSGVGAHWAAAEISVRPSTIAAFFSPSTQYSRDSSAPLSAQVEVISRSVRMSSRSIQLNRAISVPGWLHPPQSPAATDAPVPSGRCRVLGSVPAAPWASRAR
uniref:Unannotated protein n=1 Tax=freshwater metagenome TaxID=449393 RepID=A0A6J7NQ38_9ZZZZ